MPNPINIDVEFDLFWELKVRSGNGNVFYWLWGGNKGADIFSRLQTPRVGGFLMMDIEGTKAIEVPT